MSEKATPDVFGGNLRPAEAARYTGLSVSKMAKLRMAVNQHEGPPFIKVCGCIVYRRADLDEWLARHVVETAS